MQQPSIPAVRRLVTDAADADALSAVIKSAGGLGAAIALVVQDDARPLLQSLLALRAALEEDADPGLKAARLRAAARSLDHRADRLFAEAAEFFGKAAWRRSRNEAVLADDFNRRAQAAETCAEALAAQAVDHRLEAAACEGRLFRAAALAAVAA